MHSLQNRQNVKYEIIERKKSKEIKARKALKKTQDIMEKTVNLGFSEKPEIRISQKEELIMYYLAQHTGGAYGLAMAKASCGLLKRGTIYVTLNRMEKKGYVKSWISEAKPGESGPPRRLYKLTAKGSRTLSEWEIIKNQMVTGLNVALS